MECMKNTKGMTLIEVLVAVTLFAIVAIPILGLFHKSVTINVESKIKTKEATIAQSIIEDIKAGNINDRDILRKYTDDNYIPSIPEGYPKLLNDGLMEYKIKISDPKSNISYTLSAIVLSTTISSYEPPKIDIDNMTEELNN